MIVLKCKMCGGDILVSEEKTFGTCEFCGSTITLPKIDSEQRAAAFNRGNHFRRIGEFDKALAVYERIVMENDMDAEAHWCCALCRFGIEYVEDPSTYEWIPTCHRASFDSILDDVDYKAAVKYSEGLTKRQYQKDAAKIAEVQKGVLATIQNTEPFDVFISYKELDENGKRTKDSVLAQDIYYQLTEQGYRVFFSRITLEDVVGKQYEPYIFAALNSAKVMVVVGTQEKYLNATWVKNEWSRFLAMMKKDRSKVILPCYRDMDPYDMPEQLSVLQSYDMSKIGFVQDLIRGISKIIQRGKEQPIIQENIVVSQNENNINSLLDRGNMALEDRDWERADEFFEHILNIDSKNAQAYMGKALAMEKCSTIDELVQKRLEITKNVNSEILYWKVSDNHVNETINSFSIPGYLDAKKIIEQYKCDFSYKSIFSERKRQRKQEESFWLNHQWLTKAEKFGNTEIKKIIEASMGSVLSEMDIRVQIAEKQDKEAIANITANYHKSCEKGDRFVKKLHEIARKEQQEFKEKYLDLVNQAKNEKDCGRLHELLEAFEELGDYEDSCTMVKYCRDKIKKSNKMDEYIMRIMVVAMVAVIVMGYIVAFSG